MRKRTVVWSAKKAAPAIARAAAPAIARAAAPGLARAATLLAPEVGLALAAGGALYSTVKGLADMYHDPGKEYTKITAQGEETYHPSAQSLPKPLGLPHRVSHRHPIAQAPPQTPEAITQATTPEAITQATAPEAITQATAPEAITQATAPEAITQATQQAAAVPRRIDTATVGIKPFHIGSKPYNLVQWEANTHEIAEKMMSGHS